MHELEITLRACLEEALLQGHFGCSVVLVGTYACVWSRGGYCDIGYSIKSSVTRENNAQDCKQAVMLCKPSCSGDDEMGLPNHLLRHESNTAIRILNINRQTKEKKYQALV
jgi:hypothetical protein